MARERKEQAARVARAVVKCQLAIAMAALVLMMGVIVADVVLRQVIDLPVKGAYDAVGILLCISVFYALAAVIAERQEIVIDLIDEMLPARAVAALRQLAGLLSAALLVFLFWAMTGPTLDAYRYRDISLELRIPIWIVWAAALVGLAGSVLAALLVQTGLFGRGDAIRAAEHAE